MDNPSKMVNLLICTNAAYLQHAAVCLRSLLENNRDFFFNVVVVGRVGETLDEEKLRRSLEPTPWHAISFREFLPPMGQVLPLNPNAKYTLDIWSRIWVSDFFDDDVERVLYLDADIVVVGGVTPLWQMDLEGALFGAVDIPGSMRGVENLEMAEEDGYFNSGVLLFDLKQWRQSNALETLLDYVSRQYQRLKDPDQDALNACFASRRKKMDYKWNAIGPFFREPNPLPLKREIIEKVREDAVIIHYNGATKPWDFVSNHPRRKEYWKYLEMTEWRGYVPADKTLHNMLREFGSAILPKPLKAFVKKVWSPS
ncbi:glycosyltransferase family 8 protein [Acidihalobacter yilgarnensis]|nr:glycosyltransferase family 8 protein [Acidihalobacter yilgarnensis]